MATTRIRVTPAAIGIVAVVTVTAVWLAWDLDDLGWSNQYYAAVAQSGAASEWGFFHASPDLAAVTGTDKPPLAFWPMSVAVWLFGLHGWVIALPQVLESVATVALLGAMVRRVAGPVGGVVAAAVLASTPIFFVLARFNDPDTLLTLCVTVAAYATVRACESPTSRRWLVLLGASFGLAFLTKWLTAAIPAPAFLGAVLWSRRTSGSSVLRQLLARPARTALGWVLATTAVVGLPWVFAEWLMPAARRPQFDSPTNSILDLITSQNGVGRFALAPHDAASVAIQGVAGPARLLTAPFAGQIGWLLPVALVAASVAIVRVTRGARLSPAWLVLGGWLGLTVVVFSVMGGYMHPYYTVLLAPALAGVVGLGADWVWRRRDTLLGRAWWRAGVTTLVAATALYAAHILAAYPALAPWRWLVLLAGASSGLAVLAVPRSVLRRRPALLATLASIVAVAALAGPTIYAASTLGHPVDGANPIAGPVSGSAAQEPYPTALVGYLSARRSADGWLAAAVTSTAASELQLQTGEAVLPLGGFTGHAAGPGVAQVSQWVADGRLRYLVLTGPYYRGLSTPANLAGTPLAAVMAWAARHGCPAAVPEQRYIVLDLTCRSGLATG